MKPKAVVSWSGGKDCCLALHRVRKQFDIVALITMMTEDGQRSRSHGLRPELLQKQAQLLGVPLFTQAATWAEYDDAFSSLLSRVSAFGVTHAIYGDIYPDANRAWAETISAAQGLTAIEPLWAESTSHLIDEFLSMRAMALVTTVRDAYLDDSYLGSPLTVEMVQTLMRQGIDPCGERGEFHTFVTQYAGFAASIPVETGPIHRVNGCSTIDLKLAD